MSKKEEICAFVVKYKTKMENFKKDKELQIESVAKVESSLYQEPHINFGLVYAESHYNNQK